MSKSLILDIVMFYKLLNCQALGHLSAQTQNSNFRDILELVFVIGWPTQHPPTVNFRGFGLFIYLQQSIAPGWQIKHFVSESLVQMTKFLKTLFPSGLFHEQETFVADGGGGLTT